MEKEAKYSRVAEQILNLLLVGGIPAITHARVARSAKVSRAWLYKYVGSKREDLIVYALDHFGQIFAGIGAMEPQSSKRNDYLRNTIGATGKMLDKAVEYPWIIPIYFHFRNSRSVVGERIRHIVNIYLNKQSLEIAKLFKLSKDDARVAAEAFTGMRMGLAYSYLVNQMDKKADKRKLLLWIRSTMRTPRGSK